MAKLPFIPDKAMYAAVKYACKMVSCNGHFNKAIKVASDHYSVNAIDVEKYVRIAQANGKKINNTKKPKAVYYWYLINGHMAAERGGSCGYEKEYGRWHKVKATNPVNAIRRLSKCDDFSEHGSWFVYGELLQFDNEKDADEELRRKGDR